MNHLLRPLAPLTPAGWADIDDEARTRLSVALGARRLVDFAGPLGWEHSATNTGRVGSTVDTGVEGVTARPRTVIPLAEVRVDFTLSRTELNAGGRGAVDVDYGPLDRAALAIARLENATVFDGWDAMGMTGIVQASPHAPIEGPDGAEGLSRRVAAAVATLKRSDVGGPYALAVDPDVWTQISGGNDAGGELLEEHVQNILGGCIEWTPGIAKPVVLSRRGGDFILECGEDISVGYHYHDASSVNFYLEETFSFRVATEEAAVALA